MKQKVFYFPKESNFVSDEELASCFGWPQSTPHEIWKAVNGDDVRAYYYYCRDHKLLPEVLRIENKHIFTMAFESGSWLTCIWILIRIFRDFDESFGKEVAALVSLIDDEVLTKFVRIYFHSCPETFVKLAFAAGPEFDDKWVKIFNRV